MAEDVGGEDVTVIGNGRLKALDDPGARAVAARYGDPDEMLREDWIPAILGMDMARDYNEHYTADPCRYTMMELDLCRDYHPLFQRLVAGGRGGGQPAGTCCSSQG